ncbi:hypothetical protein EYF80_002051 [Liparis tanakae]|uniref:Uncharacterized protein n=1 Tax=Liparis tanakae TaxID=230148 RepID=A0A4Z2JD04_9TELE|nr:hypothetical protein EYF80_002051 [Liparis tanakae]
MEMDERVAYPVLSSSCLASLSLQANSSLKAVSCWVFKDRFCFLCSSKEMSLLLFQTLCSRPGCPWLTSSSCALTQS